MEEACSHFQNSSHFLEFLSNIILGLYWVQMCCELTWSFEKKVLQSGFIQKFFSIYSVPSVMWWECAAMQGSRTGVHQSIHVEGSFSYKLPWFGHRCHSSPIRPIYTPVIAGVSRLSNNSVHRMKMVCSITSNTRMYTKCFRNHFEIRP